MQAKLGLKDLVFVLHTLINSTSRQSQCHQHYRVPASSRVIDQSLWYEHEWFTSITPLWLTLRNHEIVNS